MPKLQTVTVRTASRMPIGAGFQEVGVSLSYVIEETEITAASVVASVQGELLDAFQSLWKHLDADTDIQADR